MSENLMPPKVETQVPFFMRGVPAGADRRIVTMVGVFNGQVVVCGPGDPHWWSMSGHDDSLPEPDVILDAGKV